MSRTIVALFVLIIGVSPVFPAGEESDQQGAFVVDGDARFTILTPQMVRMEWSEDGKFEDRASLVFINRSPAGPEYKVANENGWLVISTGKLTLRYKKDSGKFGSENLKINFTLDGEEVTWQPGLQDAGNLKGTARTLDGYDGEYTWDRKRIELGKGVISRGGWALLDDTDTHLFDGGEWNWVTGRPEDQRQDWYLLAHGHDYKQALKDFIMVAGKIPIPPRFAFGYWWSHYWIYSDRELKKLIGDIKNHDIPIDVLIIDMDWHKTYGFRATDIKRDPFGQPIGWTGYTWNRELFPEPEIFLKWMEEQNLKVALNLHPASGIPPMEERYEEFAEEIGFDTSGKNYIPYAMAEKKFAETYFKVLLRPLEQQGVDFWWLDWQQFETSKIVAGLNNTWWLNYIFFTDMERRGERPLLFHRWGGLGNHRYQIGFSGDTKTTWKSLAYQPYFTATASNVCYGYWSHDIGGHNPGAVATEPELYLRWIQFGVFSPILRTHSSKLSHSERRFWKFPDRFDLMKEAIQLRYSLAPYIYTAARQAYDTGISICRPMYYDYPDDEEAYDFKDQYMFGDEMLVAPIADPVSANDLLAKKKIWLPQGEWYEWFTGTKLEGGRIIERGYSLSEIPVFVKAGAVIPMNPKIDNLQEQVDTLVLTIMPGGDSDTVLYEDDGTTNDYQTGGYAFTCFKRENLSDGTLKLTALPGEGRYDGIPSERYYEIRLPGSFPPSQVFVNGKEYEYDYEGGKGHWAYRGSKLETVIRTPKINCEKAIEVLIRYPEEYKGREEILDGKIGLFRRLITIVNILKYEVARKDWGATLPDIILGLEQTPMKIEYHPEIILTELVKFETSFEQVIEQILNLPDADKSVLERCVRHLK